MPGQRGRFQESGGQRNENNQTQIEDGKAKRQPEAREYASLFEGPFHRLATVSATPEMRWVGCPLLIWLVNLIKYAAIGKMNALGFVPVADNVRQGK